MRLTMISFIRIGMLIRFLMLARYSIEPSNRYGWVRTDNALAPDFAMVSAISGGNTLLLILPTDGEENFTSVMSGLCGQDSIAFFRLSASWENEWFVSYAPSSIALKELSARRLRECSGRKNLLILSGDNTIPDINCTSTEEMC